MATIDHASRVNTTNQTTTSASFVDATNGGIASGSFVAGKDYLILASAQPANNVNTAATTIQLVHGSTPFADSVEDLGIAVGGERRAYFWWTVWTAVTGEDINFQHKAAAGATSSINFIQILAINLSDDLVEDTDWFYSERATDDALTTSLLTGATRTFTPGTAGHDWLVLTNAQFSSTTNTRSALSQITRSGEASSALPGVEFEPFLANGLFQLSLARVFTLGAASNTFAETAAESAASANITRFHSRVLTLNLNKFRNHVSEYTESATASSLVDFATLAESLTITPDVTGDVWVGGYFSHDTNGSGAGTNFRIQKNGVDEPAGQTTAIYLFDEGNDSNDISPFLTQCITSLTAATAYTFDLDASCNNDNTAPEIEVRSLWAVTMELAAGSITGEGAATLGADTLAATGGPVAGGTAAIQEDADTLVSAGGAPGAGTAAILEGPSTLAAAGAVDVAGQADIQEAPTTLLGVGTEDVAGSGTILEAPSTVVGVGTVTSGVTGEGAITLGPDTLASLGAAPIDGALARVLGADTIAASGTVFGPRQSVIGHDSGVNIIDLVLPQPLTAGSMIHVAIVTFQSVAGTTIVTPTDTLGHTYQPATLQQNNTPNTVHLRTWYVPGCSAGACTITVDISGVGLGEITACASEWPGRDLVSPLSGTPSLFGPTATNNPDTGAMTPSHDGSIMIGVAHAGGSPVTITEEEGWNLLREYEGQDATVTLSVIWKLQPVAAPDGATWIISASPICLAQLAAYRPAGTVGITGIAAIVLDPDVSSSGEGGVTGSRMMLLGVGR